MEYFTSDTHFNHKNIVGPTISNWKTGYRNFSSIEEMNETLINNINSVVGPDDELFHAGDFSYGEAKLVIWARKAINCKKVHLILGNHDQIFLKPSTKYLQGLFYSVSDRKEVEVQGQRLIIDHYSKRVWKGSHRGSWHLYGHSHGSLPSIGKSMDIGIDTNNFYPYSFEDIKKVLEVAPAIYLDHHTETKNIKEK